MKINLTDLEHIRASTQSKIVLCHGCFDIFHYRHLVYLKKSSELGDVLVTTVTSDKFIKKGENRPLFDEDRRIAILNELKCIDYVCLSDYPDAIEVIKHLKPNIYTKGTDVKGKENNSSENLFRENEELIRWGGKLVFIDIVPELSSTTIIDTLNHGVETMY